MICRKAFNSWVDIKAYETYPLYKAENKNSGCDTSIEYGEMQMASILAVDDSPSMRQMVSYTLERAGYEVVLANDGVEALHIAQGTDVSLVITDVNMPRMDGITLVRQLRELQAYRYKPILILTTESTTEKKMQGKEAGATGWIVKPFDPDKLVSTLRRVLD